MMASSSVVLTITSDADALFEALERVREACGFMPGSSRSPATPDDGDLDEPDTSDG